MADRPVFSTDQKTQKSLKEKTKSTGPLSSGPCRMRLEKKGRGGKTVTIIYDIPMTLEEAQKLRQTLQAQLGCGGTFKNDTIELRGDLREKVQKYFQSKGMKLVSSGG